MHLALDDEQEALKSSLKDFAKDRLRAGSRDWDEAGAIPDASLAEGWGLGLLLAGIPAALGGASESDKPSALTNAIALEELAWGDLAYAHARSSRRTSSRSPCSSTEPTPRNARSCPP